MIGANRNLRRLVIALTAVLLTVGLVAGGSRMFAQRAKMRPNRLGVSTCVLERVEGLDLCIRGLDAIDGSPVLDVKPFMREFEPPGDAVRQPSWATELMRGYF